MFETTVVPIQEHSSAKRLRLLTVSVAVHSSIILGAIVFSIASVELPTTPPDEVRRAPLLTQVQIPPPLGNPDGGRTERAAQPVQKPEPRQPAPDQVTAPPAIPDELPQLEAPGVGPTTEGTGPGDGSVPGPIGVPWVVEGGFGPLDGPPVTAAVPEVKDRIYEVNEVVAPRIVHRVDPPYPGVMISLRRPATVIVRCVIDRNGGVRDVSIVRGAAPPFNEAVLRAVRQWRFTPGLLGDRPVETYMTLTVNFNVR